MHPTLGLWALVQGLQRGCTGGLLLPTGLCAAARGLGAASMSSWTRGAVGRYRPATGGMLDDTTAAARQVRPRPRRPPTACSLSCNVHCRHPSTSRNAMAPTPVCKTLTACLPAWPSCQQGAMVVLVSGGVESAALLAYYQHWSHGQELLPL